ncbi:HEAT repeat domain-containing protein [Actinomadura sp. NPDC049753]|uniref:HEAT repeat domain-containing protein n=1 Tax=Actinomadura sp. NPDC049753 TaxID=3154739 RepID=UPI00343E1668
MRIQIAWLTAEIADRPETVRDEPPGELLYQAVRGIGVTDVDEPELLVQELMGRLDPVLRSEALRVTREALHAGLLAPERARTLVVGLTGSIAGEPAAGTAAAGVAPAALRELAEPWAALDPLPQEHLYRFLEAGPGGAVPAVAAAAIEAAARHGHQDLLRDIAADRGRPPGLRQRALELLGDLATRDDIGDLVSIAATDPLLLAGPVTRCLRGLHRRGHFPAGGAVPAIVRLAVADHSVPAGEVATILFTSRQETLKELMGADADDPHWPRRLELLVALAAQGAGDLPVGEKVTDLLRSAPDARPFLRAIRALRHTAAEEAVIAALPRSPAAAVEALEAVGGARTVTALRDGLGLDGPDGSGAVAPHLRPVRHRALEVLWHLTEDPDQRRSILVRLDPRDLPVRIAADLGGPDERELAFLRAGLDPEKPVDALCRLARNAGSETVPAIADLLLRVVADLAASWAPDASGDASEPTVPQEVVAAVRDLGGRLHERGRIRPRCLLDAADAREAGDALVAGIALDLLDRPDLTAAEQMVLLSLLLQTSHRGIRARVHPLLRHRDRHVRKHVIALLARDADGEDAQALSASLIPLTAASDAQTARQALLALGHARACWAAAAIAACLDHPNMNVKKTAANALVHAGAPVAVPKLLFWLGRHDNPGLQSALVAALRTILGDAYAATVVAAADRAADDRTRALLLAGLDGALSARAVGALADQGSPAGAALLSLVAARRLTLGSGTAAELADRMAAHGITPPSRRQGPRAARPDAEIDALADRGWNTEIARRLAEGFDRDSAELTAERLSRLRPMLERWLELAAEEPEQRGRVLRLALRLCPPPWTAGETEAFSRSARTLVAGLAEIGDAHRDRLLALLEDTVGRLPSTSGFDIAARIRALPPEAVGGRSLLVLLRRCGAVLTRTDLGRALAAARAGANPWLAEAEVLREAFGLAGPASDRAETSEPPAVGRWRDALSAAARTHDGLRRFRVADRPVDLDDRPIGSRDRLRALIDVFVEAGTGVRGPLLDWMVELQPLDAPTWTIAEDARRSASDRAAGPGDRDQPRSAVLRERLLRLLEEPERDRREAAARAMLGWPEPEFRLAVLHAFLDGRVDLAVSGDLAQALTLMNETELRRAGDRGSGGEAVRERIARVASHLDPPDVDRFIPLLAAWWEHGGPSLHTSAGRALRKADPDVLAEALSGRLDNGDWGLLDLISGVALLRTPALARAHRRLREEGRHDLADKLVLVDEPLRRPGAAERDSAALSALRSRPPVPEAGRRPTRAELFRLARTGGPEQIRRALTLLAERHDDDPARTRRHGADRPADPDPEFRELLAESLGHPEARVRLHAHRISRKVMDREDYLEHTVLLLDDRQPDIVRSAVKTLCHAAWKPAVPALVGLLTHSHPAVRRAVSDGLVLLGAPAIPALRHAAGRARPDRRNLYTTVLDKITEAPDGAASSPRDPAGPSGRRS